MTAEEFNKKWEKRLEEGHYGMSYDSEEIIHYVDEEFSKLEKICPNFTFSQIKDKWGPRVYLENDLGHSIEIENGIREIYKERRNKEVHNDNS